jgi:hypothetical protein
METEEVETPHGVILAPTAAKPEADPIDPDDVDALIANASATFSRWCLSGYVGENFCNCWRCRRRRNEPPEETLAELEARDIDAWVERRKASSASYIPCPPIPSESRVTPTLDDVIRATCPEPIQLGLVVSLSVPFDANKPVAPSPLERGMVGARVTFTPSAWNASGHAVGCNALGCVPHCKKPRGNA